MSDKIYWKDINVDTGGFNVTRKGNCWYADDKLVYWHGQEAAEAQTFLRGIELRPDEIETLGERLRDENVSEDEYNRRMGLT